MMPARLGFVKARRRAAHRGEQSYDFYATVLRLQDFDRLPGDVDAGARLGNFAQMLDDQAVQRLRAVQRELRAELAVERAQRRQAVDDDAAVGARGGRCRRRRAPAS